MNEWSFSSQGLQVEHLRIVHINIKVSKPWFKIIHLLKETFGLQLFVFIGRTDVEAETPILCPPHAKSWFIGKDWCWEGLGAWGEGDDRGWDGWMASLTWWTWVWVNSGSWWWTGRPGVLRYMGLQGIGRDWVTELNWTEQYEKWFLFRRFGVYFDAWYIF